MQEYGFLFEGLSKGLRHSLENKHGNQALVEVTNAKPSEFGLEFAEELVPYYEVTDPILPGFPFPQMLVLKAITLYITSTAIYEYNGVSLTLRHTFSVAQTARVEVLDYEQHIAIVGEHLTVIKDGDTGVWSEYAGTDMPKAKTGCDFKGQMIFGNLESWYDNPNPEALVAWSRIGYQNFDLGHYTDDNDSSTTQGARRGQVGFHRMKQSDQLLRVKRLGDFVVLYGNESIEMLTPVMQPMPTFGLTKLFDFGIIDKMAVGGNEKEHIFITSEGALYRMSANGTERLDYREFFQPMIGSDIAITYNAVDHEYYITDGTDCYVLTRYGLGKTEQIILDGGVINGNFESLANVRSNDDCGYVSDRLDLGMRSLKTLYAQELGIDTVDTATLGIDWKRDLKADWRRTNMVRVGPEGIATIPVSASVFRLVVNIPDCTGALFDRHSVRWKLTDLRSTRGAYSGDS